MSQTNRREFLKSMGAAATAAGLGARLAGGAPPESPPVEGRGRQPNIILVLADDLGLSRVSCCGGDQFRTPNIDRLAAGGVRFERCYSTPLCGPTRAVLLTGRYGFRTGGITQGASGQLDLDREVPLPRMLRQAGYATCAIGKWGQVSQLKDADGAKRWGWDRHMLWIGAGSADRYWGPRYLKDGKEFTGGADQFGPDLTHEFAVEFMKANREKPFFLYYSTPLTHAPFVSTPDNKDEARRVEGMVEYLDKLMGRLVDDLEKLKLRQNTIILFTSDNGPHGKPSGTIGGKAMTGAKGSLLEGGCREPLIVNCPGLVPQGKVLADLTDFTDFHATCAELAGAKAPAGIVFDGHSFAPQITGKAGKSREWVHVQLGNGYFIADRKHKLYGDGTFVDIGDSPFTEKPVAAPPESGGQEARRRLAAAMKALRGGEAAAASVPASRPAGPRRGGKKAK